MLATCRVLDRMVLPATSGPSGHGASLVNTAVDPAGMHIPLLVAGAEASVGRRFLGHGAKNSPTSLPAGLGLMSPLSLVGLNRTLALRVLHLSESAARSTYPSYAWAAIGHGGSPHAQSLTGLGGEQVLHLREDRAGRMPVLGLAAWGLLRGDHRAGAQS